VVVAHTFSIGFASFVGAAQVDCPAARGEAQWVSNKTMRRRDLLAGVTAAALVAGCGEAHAASAAPWSSGSETPQFKAPPGSTDCHHYIYDHRVPAVSDRIKHPDDAPPDDYRALMRRLGLARQVLMQPSAYGTDNRCLLDALATFGSNARAIAVVDAAVTDAELKRFDGLGVRGLYFNFAPSNGVTTAAMIEPLARRIAPLGWHVEVNVWAADWPPLFPVLARLPTPVVLDRFGHIPEPEGADHPLFAQIRRLLDSGKTWIKLVAPYDASKAGPPGYADSGALARAYIDAAPERVVWGTNWPHPGEDPKPDDAAMFDLLAGWAPEASMRNRILVENPALLYGFP
jgi:D-galactarolactone isomerase